MTTTRRSVMWPFIIIVIGCIWLLKTVGTFPDAVGDILLRAWPALLVVLGIDVLVGRRRLRISRWAIDLNLIGVGVTILALVGIVWLAYNKQADVLRTDNVKTLTEPVPAEVDSVRIDLAVERTTIIISPSDARVVTAEFQGSNESDVTLSWSVEAGVGVLLVDETLANAIPKLEDYGRGTLNVTLPVEVPVQQITVNGTQGDVQVDMLPLRVERIDVAMNGGDLALNLPAQDTLVGSLRTENGGIALTVPDAMALTVGLASGSGDPKYEYDVLRYDVLREGTLRRKNADPFQIALDVWLKDGALLTIVDVE